MNKKKKNGEVALREAAGHESSFVKNIFAVCLILIKVKSITGNVCQNFLPAESRKTADEASTVSNLPRETLASSTHACGPQYPDVFSENRSVSTLTEAEKISLLIGKWDSEDLCKYKFPLRFDV